MVESLLRSFGLRTGLFTSPHLVGRPGADLLRRRADLGGPPAGHLGGDRPLRRRSSTPTRPPTGACPCSYFEVMTALAFAAFADAPVDVAIVEVGLGGGWDSTNVADGVRGRHRADRARPREYLGDSIAGIAREKAGIIKPGAIAVVAEQELVAAEAILERAVEVDAVVAREGLEFGVVGRGLAVGGQVLNLKGLNAAVRRGVPPAVRRAPGAQRRPGARGGRGAARRRGAARCRSRPRRVRDGHVARAGSRSCAAARRSSSMRPTTRTAPRRWRGRSSTPSTSPRWWASSGCCRTRTRWAC